MVDRVRVRVRFPTDSGRALLNWQGRVSPDTIVTVANRTLATGESQCSERYCCLLAPPRAMAKARQVNLFSSPGRQQSFSYQQEPSLLRRNHTRSHTPRTPAQDLSIAENILWIASPCAASATRLAMPMEDLTGRSR